MQYPILIAAAALCFFVLVPGCGAYLVRARWRRFRLRLLASLDVPLYQPGRTDLKGGTAREFRFNGVLEAVQDNDRLWLRDNHASVALHLRRRTIFMLPSDSRPDMESLYADSMRSLRWERTSVLPEGLGVFVCGKLVMEAGLPSFGVADGDEPLVILYDGDPRTVMARAIWFGRQRNEYWNDVTPISLLTGFAGLLALAFYGFRDDFTRYAAIVAATLSLVPFAPLMPPGIIGFFLYRRRWLHGRGLRARRDLAFLAQKVEEAGLGAEADIPDLGGAAVHRGRLATGRIRWLETSAVLILLAGVAVNLYIVLALIIQLFNYAR